jgi:hypothetical protein
LRIFNNGDPDCFHIFANHLGIAILKRGSSFNDSEKLMEKFMSKGRDSKKSAKKKPQKTMKEKRKEKRIKKQG